MPTICLYNCRRFMSYLNNTHFVGASGPVAFAGADRTGIININQHIDNGSQMVGQFSPEVNRNLSERLELDETIIRWMTSDGKHPTDGTLSEFYVHLFKYVVHNRVSVNFSFQIRQVPLYF